MVIVINSYIFNDEHLLHKHTHVWFEIHRQAVTILIL